MLQVRDPRARDLAKVVAHRDGISLSAAVVKALEAEARRTERRETVEETINRLHDELFQNGKPGRLMTKEEIDDMWGHPPDNG